MPSPKNALSSGTSAGCQPTVVEWMETHQRIMGFWLDRLIEDGDDCEFVTMLHRQQSWLGMMLERVREE